MKSHVIKRKRRKREKESGVKERKEYSTRIRKDIEKKYIELTYKRKKNP